MRRRDVLSLLGGAAVSWPRVGSAQQTEPVRRSAVLVPLPETAWLPVWDELRQHGYVEGATLSVDRRGFEARYEQFPKIVADLIQGKPDVIMCGGDAAIRAVQRARAVAADHCRDRRPRCTSADPLRAGDQREDREGPRARCASHAARSG
jgi:hypothetical protein